MSKKSFILGNVVKSAVASPAGFLRNVAMITACLAGMTMFSGCDKDPDPIDEPNNPPIINV